jgi:hypothetical protein
MKFESWDQVGMWLAVQFPVAALCGFCVWYSLRWTSGKHTEELKRNETERERLLAEKDKRLAEKDEQIRKLEAERERLMVLRFPSWGKEQKEGGTPQ